MGNTSAPSTPAPPKLSGLCGSEFGIGTVLHDVHLPLAKLLLQAVERVCDALLLDQVDDSADGSNDEEEHADHSARNCASVA